MILLYIHIVSIGEIKTRKSTHFCSEHVTIVIKNETNALMDKFVVKTAAVPWKEKTRSHLPVNLTAKDRAVKYPEGTFHVDDGLLFCSSCNVVIDHLRKCEVDKHLEAASHEQNVEKNQGSKHQTNFDSLSANRLKINYRCDVHVFDF